MILKHFHIFLYIMNISNMSTKTAMPTAMKNFLESLLSSVSLRFLLLVDML